MSTDKTCSGCGKIDGTVHRHMFDGQCADCVDISLYDYDYAKKAEEKNNELNERIS